LSGIGSGVELIPKSSGTGLGIGIASELIAEVAEVF
jgi:hypothetical protein